MAVRNVKLNVGSGPDWVATSGHMKIQRALQGLNDDGDLIFAVPERVNFTRSGAQVPLQVGQAYRFTPNDPKGPARLCVIPAGSGVVDYADLQDIDPETLEPIDALPPTTLEVLTGKQDIATLDADNAALVEDDDSDLAGVLSARIAQGLGSTFPGAAFGNGLRLGVTPAAYAPSTALDGQALSAGAGNVTVQSPTGATVFGVTAAGDAVGVLSGTSSPTFVSYDAGTVRGGEPYQRRARMVVKALNAVGTANGFGVFSGATLTGATLNWFRSNIATATRYYLLQKATATTLAGLSSSASTILTSTVVAQVGDIVDLEVQAKYVRMTVTRLDGTPALLLEQPLDATEQETYRAGERAGVWAQPSSYPAGAIASFGFVDSATTGTTTRTPVSVSAATSQLPPWVRFEPSQIQQIRDAVVPGRRDIRAFGAKVDGQIVTAASTAGSAVVTPTGYKFKSTDVGKAIAVKGAGPEVTNGNDRVWLSTIISVDTTTGTATLGSNATYTVASAECVFGTADDEAVFRAGQECWLNGGGEVYFPPGITVVTKPYRVRNFTSFAGAGRDQSKVYVLQDTVSGGSWLYVTGVNESNPITGVILRGFTVNAWAMFNTGGWTATIKPLNLFDVKNCAAIDMAIIDSPATALPFDHSVQSCLLAHNLIIRPGRLAPVGVGPGGSGIGLGTSGTGDSDPTLVFGNSIIGSTTSSSAGVGNNGIFVEAQSGASPDLGTVGYRIYGNYIEGMPVGISDQGSTGTLIQGNQIHGCTVGVRIKESDLGNSSPGRYTHIDGNIIAKATGPGASDGVGILLSTVGDNPATTPKIYTKITNNSIFGCKSEGVIVEAAYSNIIGTMLMGNDIRDNGLSGVKVRGTSEHRHMAIVHNQISSNGRRGTSGDQAAVLIASGATLRGGRVQDNDWYDLETVPTQTAGLVQTGATLVTVTVSGNTT